MTNTEINLAEQPCCGYYSYLLKFYAIFFVLNFFFPFLYFVDIVEKYENQEFKEAQNNQYTISLN